MKQKDNKGFSLVEVLVASSLIALVLVPATEALQNGIDNSDIYEEHSADHYHVIDKMEEVLAKDYDSLLQASIAAGDPTIASSFSDMLIETDGREINRVVFLSLYDGDNADADDNAFTGTDAGLLWVHVEIPGSVHAVETLTSHF